jgi:hypothetical protein
MVRVTGNASFKESLWRSPLLPLVVNTLKDYFRLPIPLFQKIINIPSVVYALECSYGAVVPYYLRLLKDALVKLLRRMSCD